MVTILLIFISCENASYEEKRALTIYQESQASWVRNFNPLTPAGSARWPTSSGIYEPLFIYNSLKAEYVPWLGVDYYWNSDNTILFLQTRSGVTWSDGKPFTAEDSLT